MSLAPDQKRWPNIYRAAAALDEPTYRRLLRTATGKTSLRDDRMDPKGDFDRIMVALETILWARVDAGLVPDPIEAGNRHIRRRDHWQRRNPGKGLINSRQMRIIQDLWTQLCPMLPPKQRNNDYAIGIIARAAGCDHSQIHRLHADQAAKAIEALRAMIQRKIREHNQVAG